MLVAATACGGASQGGSAAPRTKAWAYRFAVDRALSRLTARVCFTGKVPDRLVPIHRNGRRNLKGARGPLGPKAEPLEVDGDGMDGGIVTAGLPDNACLQYTVDLESAARQRGGLQGAYRIGDDLIASTGVWLWAPAVRSRRARVTAAFDLPPGIRVSAVWPSIGENRYRLDERAFVFTAYAAFGRFRNRSVPVPGACLHVSVLGGGVDMGRAALTRCLRKSAFAASMMLGRFPTREAAVLLVPTPFSQASPFGIVGRGTRPTVAVLVGQHAEEARLCRAWVPVHEFSHLATPYIERRDAWLPEGLSTYYQEVLRARASLLTGNEAFRRLHAGFEVGRMQGTGRTLRAESREMVRTGAFRRVYWAGAAVALIADVAIRRTTGGAYSLDDALGELNRCCAASPRSFGAEEAIRRLPGPASRVLRAVAERHLQRAAFPDLRPTYRALGLSAEGRRLRFGQQPSARALRARIMGAPADLAPLPPCRETSATQRRDRTLDD